MNLRRVLVIGLEFVEPLFSGNGILTHSVVRSLMRQSYDVTVLCAQPNIRQTTSNNPTTLNSNSTTYHEAEQSQNLRIISVNVPGEKWKRLDKGSAWKEMAENAPESVILNEHFGKFDFVLGIDWSAMATYNALKSYNLLPESSIYINLVFRIFSKSKELIKSSDDEHFYHKSEVVAMEEAAVTFALSHVDKKELNNLIEDKDYDPVSHPTINVLIPPLREDFLRLAKSMTYTSMDYSRKYLLFNARFSPEKNLVLFAKMMKKLSDDGYLKKWNVTPLLIGSICDTDYANLVRSLLPSEAKVINDFLQPEELLFYLKQTVLLIHPPVYESYGMVIAEAAAAGTPTIMHKDSIGVSSLFSVDKGEIITTDMSSLRKATSSVIKIMSYRNYLSEVGQKAQNRAFEWTTEDYGAMLTKKIYEKVATLY